MENKIDYTNTKCVDGFVSIKISLSCTGLKYQNENKVRICLAKQICNTFFDEYTNKNSTYGKYIQWWRQFALHFRKTL